MLPLAVRAPRIGATLFRASRSVSVCRSVRAAGVLPYAGDVCFRRVAEIRELGDGIVGVNPGRDLGVSACEQFGNGEQINAVLRKFSGLRYLQPLPLQ